MDKDPNELFEEMNRDMEFLRKSVYVDEGYVVLNVQYEYTIPVTSLRSHEAILGWVYHLTEKTWMSRDLLGQFIVVATKAAGLDMPRFNPG